MLNEMKSAFGGNKTIYKVGAGIVTASLLLSSMATAAFADYVAEISGNGAGSTNTIYIKNKSNCNVYQKNSTGVLTEIESSASTGGNKANGNNGGDVTIDTGNATSTVGVSVEGSSNTASNPCCCTCDGCESQPAEHTALISGNGEGSNNSVTLKKIKSSEVKQRNRTEVLTGVLSKARTGRNKAKNNTGGTVDVLTGNAVSNVDVVVAAPSNSLNP